MSWQPEDLAFVLIAACFPLIVIGMIVTTLIGGCA